VAGAIGSGVHLEREFARAVGQGNVNRGRGISAAEGPSAEDFFAGDLHDKLRGAAHAFSVEVIVYAAKALNSLSARRRLEDNLAAGVGAEPVVEPALAGS